MKTTELGMFNTVVMEISSLCNRSCVFCPWHKEKKTKNKFLDIETINIVVDQLVEINYRGRIELSLYNEPLLDKRIHEICETITKKLKRVNICYMSNGDFIKSSDDIEKIFSSGTKIFRINAYDTESYTRLTKIVEDFLSNTEFDVSDKYHGTNPRKDQYILEFCNKTSIDNINSLHGAEKLQNRAGNIPWHMSSAPSPIQKSCYRPFRMLVINHKGDVVLCCNDFRGVVNFGNVEEKRIMDIWHSEEMNHYRRILLKEERNGLPLCDICDFGGGYYRHLLKYSWNKLVEKEKSNDLSSYF